ncbi:MAG: hypothetical protein CM15mP79_1990 [Methanobacteriota archaeon]|nr:MAG: hypothetical protein CM15mP79_1990 [Euryarchaeota archaeon]
MQHTRRRTIFRRRLSSTTDYRRRLRLLKSGMPRAVVRVSNTRTTAQITSYHKDGDVVIATVTGSDLSSRYGWPADLSRSPSRPPTSSALPSARRPLRPVTTKPCSTSGSLPAPPATASMPRSAAWSMPVLRSRTAKTCFPTMTASTAPHRRIHRGQGGSLPHHH